MTVETVPLCGGRPVSTKHRIPPRPNTSLCSVASAAPPACSGAMYAGVPIARPSSVRLRFGTLICVVPPPSRGSAPGDRDCGDASTFASPQSITWTRPPSETITLLGVRSRWTTPLAWA